MTAIGLNPGFSVPLLHARTAAGAVVAAAAAAGVFGITSADPFAASGSAMTLISEVASSGAKTDTAVFDLTFPGQTFEGSQFTMTVRAKMTTAGAGTLTLDATAHEMSDSGVTGPELCLTDVQNVGTVDTDYTFTIDSTLLQPGARALIALKMVATSGTAFNTSGEIKSVRFS